ncbi:MAG TPA: erythromycin esterase family protein [Ilumatobacteraceae bacterium]|nr:erythromycin esterase family protein [Ilumatobacteraceae bacterium]
MTVLPDRLRTASGSALAALGNAARPIEGRDDDYDELLAEISDRRVVLIGEATHGSHDFYLERARITQRLIEDHGFTVVAVEADWPDAYRVNRYVMGLSNDRSAAEALADFRRFPTWMWRNTEVVQFVDWLRDRNDTISDPLRMARFHGLDLYSLRTSIEAVVAYLDTIDPDEAQRARARYSCFDHVGAEGQAYGFALAHQRAIPCEDEVVAQLVSLRRQAAEYAQRDGWLAEDELFCAEQNAVVVRDAEEYYQQMYRADVSSWNLRDRHMAATLDALLDHFDRRGGRTKVVVWEHNSHIGDARATAMSTRGELNVGQLARQRYGEHAVALIGLTTYDGEVTAATDWGQPARRRTVRPGLPESYEHLLHEVVAERLAPARFWMPMTDPDAAAVLAESRLERAIGVVYRPQTERPSHYFPARLDRQFDVVIHIDRTSALQPLDDIAAWDPLEPPETYPTGI